MAQHRVLLPLEVTLRLHIALLERDLAQVQARCIRYEAQHLHDQAERQYAQTAETLLAPLSDRPPPGVVYSVDVAEGCLVYDVPEAPATLDPETFFCPKN